jgi:hypothetical protein
MMTGSDEKDCHKCPAPSEEALFSVMKSGPLEAINRPFGLRRPNRVAATPTVLTVGLTHLDTSEDYSRRGTLSSLRPFPLQEGPGRPYRQ